MMNYKKYDRFLGVLILLVGMLLMLPLFAHAQEANVQVTLSQPLGPEEDIGQAVLYVSPTGVDSEYAEAQRIEGIAPLSDTQADPLQFIYGFYAPPATETYRYFKTSFIDNAGNESAFSAPIVFKADKLPPGAPVGLTATSVEIAE